jgi:hypothetical protein
MMSDRLTKKSSGQHGVGTALVGVGLFVLLTTIFGGGFIGVAWPFFVLAPGLLLFYLVKQLGQKAAGLAIPASIISSVGLILFYQNLTGHWESWAYAWALVMPTALGMGLAVYGDLAHKEQIAEVGEKMARFGMGLFFLGLLFFELLLNISGIMTGIMWLIVPLLLIAGGIYLRRTKRRHSFDPSSIRDRAVDTLGDASSYVETPIYDREREMA